VARARASIAAFAVAVSLSAAASADIEGDQFVSAEWRVRLTAAKNWQLTEKTAYPSVLLRMVRRAPDGKMLLTAERVKAGTDGRAFALRTAELLRKMGFTVRPPQLHSSTGAYFIDSNRGGSFLRQAFLVDKEVGYSLTLEAPNNRTRSQHLRAFDFTLRSIQILREEEVPAATGEKPAEDTPPPPAAGEQSGQR
jgi:hypothetical protein